MENSPAHRHRPRLRQPPIRSTKHPDPSNNNNNSSSNNNLPEPPGLVNRDEIMVQPGSSTSDSKPPPKTTISNNMELQQTPDAPSSSSFASQKIIISCCSRPPAPDHPSKYHQHHHKSKSRHPELSSIQSDHYHHQNCCCCRFNCCCCFTNQGCCHRIESDHHQANKSYKSSQMSSSSYSKIIYNLINFHHHYSEQSSLNDIFGYLRNSFGKGRKRNPSSSSSSNVLILFIISILFIILLDPPKRISCDSLIGKLSSSLSSSSPPPQSRLSRLVVMAQGAQQQELDLEDMRQQRFRKRPDEWLSVQEGDSVVLNCEVDYQAGPAVWKKDDEYLFSNRTREPMAPDRYSLPGDGSNGVNSLRLTSVQLDDAGTYECQIGSDPAERVKLLRAKTSVSVQAKPIPPPSSLPPTSASDNHHQQTPTAHQLASASTTNGGSEFATPHLTKESQLQARDTILSLPKLSQGSSLQLSSASFITPQASAAHQARNSSPAGANNANLPAALMISWPYILLALAGLLMMANIYLIYTLVKRHQRMRAPSRIATAHPPSNSSGGGGGSTTSTGASSCGHSNSSTSSSSNNNNNHNNHIINTNNY